MDFSSYWSYLGMDSKPEILEKEWWRLWWNEWVEWIAKNPYDFLFYLFMCLTPLFILSLILSWQLSKSLMAQSKKRVSSTRKTTVSVTSTSPTRPRTSRALRSNVTKTD